MQTADVSEGMKMSSPDLQWLKNLLAEVALSLYHVPENKDSELVVIEQCRR